MLSNTGAGGSDSSSGGGAAGAVGDFESAAEAEVSLGFAFSAEVTANCTRSMTRPPTPPSMRSLLPGY